MFACMIECVNGLKSVKRGKSGSKTCTSSHSQWDCSKYRIVVIPMATVWRQCKWAPWNYTLSNLQILSYNSVQHLLVLTPYRFHSECHRQKTINLVYFVPNKSLDIPALWTGSETDAQCLSIRVPQIPLQQQVSSCGIGNTTIALPPRSHSFPHHFENRIELL